MPETIVLTGVSGFIAKHIALKLLERGYAVRGSVRSPARADEVRATLGRHLRDRTALDRLSFVTLDLAKDDGWEAALDGATALIHTASPFPVSQPKDEGELIRPAVDGTLRALRAAKAAGVSRVVLTSSIAAITSTDHPPGGEYTEADWSRPDHPTSTPYIRSKTFAERAAWDFVKDNPDVALTAINPGFVLGPPLDTAFGTSVAVVRRLLSGKDPAAPRVGFSCVDVRDVAEAHVRALERPATAGKRYAAVAGPLWFAEMNSILRQAYPDRRIARLQAPDLMIRILALFDSEVRTIAPLLGRLDRISNAAARRDLGIDFVPAGDALRATADFLVTNRLV